jgi:hypothetical protein
MNILFESPILSYQIRIQIPCEPRIAMIRRLSLETYAQGLLTTGIRFWSQADYNPNDFLMD